MKTATQVNTRSLVTVLQQARRWWKIRELKRLWCEEIQMVKIAKRRHWQCVLERFHVERRYQLIKILARIDQERGYL